MAATIREHHPNPFTHVGAGMFDDRVGALKDRVAALSDKQIIVEMAKIVALLKDGHTRLALPRQHTELMFSFSHSTPRPPALGSLKFTAPPLKFRVFGARLYIVRAEAARNDLIGAEVLVALDIIDDPDAVTLGIRRHRPGADRCRRRL